MQVLHQHIGRDGFRLRGTEMSRIDGFSDVVFGFGLTLLVASLEVPKTYSELHEVMLGFVPFFICFVFFIMVWWAHFRFFRRYGLHDIATILLNSALLFTVLFYAYPMKFLFTVAVRSHAANEGSVFQSASQIRELMLIYGGGFTAVYLLFAALYFNAWRQRHALGLNPLEKTLTLAYMWDDFGTACVGMIVCVVALIVRPGHATEAAYCFFLIGVWKSIHGTVAGRRTRRARERCTEDDLHSLPRHHSA